MIDMVVIILQILGIIIFIGTVAGIIRMPDFYSRMHAASKGDTLSSLCLLGGFAIYVLQDFSYSSFLLATKIFFIIIFTFISSPAAAYALLEAAFSTGAKPFQKKENNDLEP